MRAEQHLGDPALVGAGSYAYDAASRLQTLTQDLGGSAHAQSLGFSYTPASQIAAATRSNDAFAWTGHYNVNRAYTANGLNQYATVGSVTPTHDARGNKTFEGTRTFAFDSQTRLTSASSGQSRPTGSNCLSCRSERNSLFEDRILRIRLAGAAGSDVAAVSLLSYWKPERLFRAN